MLFWKSLTKIRQQYVRNVRGISERPSQVNLVPRSFPLKVGGAGKDPSHLQGKSPGNEVVPKLEGKLRARHPDHPNKKSTISIVI